jgi:hypothetical protein
MGQRHHRTICASTIDDAFPWCVADCIMIQLIEVARQANDFLTGSKHITQQKPINTRSKL